ncbi:MAG: dTMP kinase [Armatimonadota bacterium]
MAGTFITIEGPEGCGKSTQMALLDEHLWKQGIKAVLTHEPGGTSVGEQIRRILLDRETRNMDAICELLLFEASRAQHLAEVVRPALEAGEVVISDRFSASSFAYQGSALGLGQEMVEAVERVATTNCRPDITIILDVEPAEGLRRKGSGTLPFDRIEGRPLEFHRAVRAGYLEFARAHPDFVKVLDGMQPIETVHSQVAEAVSKILPDGRR